MIRDLIQALYSRFLRRSCVVLLCVTSETMFRGGRGGGGRGGGGRGPPRGEWINETSLENRILRGLCDGGFQLVMPIVSW